MGEENRVVEGIRQALNSHDVNALTAWFGEDYENTWPAHPSRGFHGRDQVRRNWEQIFASVPDFQAEVVGAAYDAHVAFTEREFTGTRRDGSANHLRGAIVLGVTGGLVRWARFYMEPVDESTESVDQAVRRQVAGR